MKSISLKLPDELDQQLTSVACARKATKSDLIREALELYFKEDTGNRPGASWRLAGDLVGSVEGPEYLSIDKRYLDGFGA